MKVRLTSGDIEKIAGYTPRQLHNLCESGILIPERDGVGPGCFRFFGTMQALALAYAARWARIGGSRKSIEKIFDAVLNYSEKQLLAEFAKGRTHLIPRVDAPMKLIGWPANDTDADNPFDLKAVYENVKETIAKLAEEEGGVEVRRGRRRGLAMAR